MGRVPSEVSSDVQLVVCRCVWVSVLGGNRYLQCNDAKVLLCVLCCFAS